MARSCLFVTSLINVFQLSSISQDFFSITSNFYFIRKDKTLKNEPSKESKEMSMKTDKTKDIQLLRR